VGDEFCLLTGWSKEELLVGGSESGDNQEDTPRKKFIYELFENQSVVEYWENFASHAFESTTQSVFSHCVLLKPNGAPVPCTFCFSIRRDLLDLPNLCVGQWLPLLWCTFYYSFFSIRIHDIVTVPCFHNFVTLLTSFLVINFSYITLF